MNRRLLAHLALLLAALIWGVAFVAQDVAMDSLEPFTFNGARMLLAGLALLPFLYWRERRAGAAGRGGAHPRRDAPPNTGKARKALWAAGFWCGLMLFLGSSFQQLGIARTSPGKAGFVTALYIVLVPLAGLFKRRRLHAAVWLAVAVSTAGLFLLCVAEALGIGAGDVYLILCAVSFTGHILVIDHFSRRVDCARLSCVQFFVCAGLSLPVAALWEQPTLEGLVRGAVPILYAGVFSGAVGYTLQILGQRDTDPSVASLILCLESVFAALAGWLLLGDVLTPRELSGCALMFMGIVLAQWPAKAGSA